MNIISCPYCGIPLENLSDGYLSCNSCRTVLSVCENSRDYINEECFICPNCGTPEIASPNSKKCKKCGKPLQVNCGFCKGEHPLGIFFADRHTIFPLPKILVFTIQDLREVECSLEKELSERNSIETEIEKLYGQMFGKTTISTESWREAVEAFEFILHNGEEKSEIDKLERKLRANKGNIKRLRLNLEKIARALKTMASKNRILIRIFELLDSVEIETLQMILDENENQEGTI
jgi:hypothetical protein